MKGQALLQVTHRVGWQFQPKCYEEQVATNSPTLVFMTKLFGENVCSEMIHICCFHWSCVVFATWPCVLIETTILHHVIHALTKTDSFKKKKIASYCFPLGGVNPEPISGAHCCYHCLSHNSGLSHLCRFLLLLAVYCVPCALQRLLQHLGKHWLFLL